MHEKQVAIYLFFINLQWGLFRKNSQRVEVVRYFRGRASSWMFDRTLNAVLPNNLITARRKYEEKLPTTEVTQVNLGLLLLPNSPDFQQNNKTKSCADPASSFPWVRKHQQKTFATFSGFWLLRGWGWVEWIRSKGKFVTKIFSSDKLMNVEWSSKTLWKIMSADDVKVNKNNKK